MSSTAWARARVESAALQEQRARLDVQVRLEEGRARRSSLIERAQREGAVWQTDFGAPDRVAAPGSTLAEMVEHGEQLAKASDAFERELNARLRVLQIRRATNRLAELGQSASDAPSTPPRATRDARPVQRHDVHHPSDGDVELVVADVLARAASEGYDVDVLAPLAAAARAASGAERELAVVHLRAGVKRLHHSRREEDRREAALQEQARKLELVVGQLSAAGIDADLDPELDAARVHIRQGDPLDPAALAALVAQGDAAVRGASALLEHRELENALEAVLSELGLSPVLGMGTATVRDGILVSRPGWPSHAVETRIVGGDLSLEAVRIDDEKTSPSSSQRDAEVEREFCEQLPQIFTELGRRNVVLDGQQVIPPGVSRLRRRSSIAPVATPRTSSASTGRREHEAGA